MSTITRERRTQQLIAQLKTHPHRDEILRLMQEQIKDDTEVNVNLL